MREDFLLPSVTARRLYQAIGNCPIYDYHCHLSPREIWEDTPFDNIGELWLAGDHYKWRLMRAAGVPEERITGTAGWHDKFTAYAGAVELAAGNPLYHWSHMELSRYFGIDTPLGSDTAEEIWTAANRVIHERGLSPRKLILQSRAAYIGTTDDIADDLTYHKKLAADPAFPVRVAPTFRLDAVLLLNREGYAAYIDRLEAAAGMPIDRLDALQTAGTAADSPMSAFPFSPRAPATRPRPIAPSARHAGVNPSPTPILWPSSGRCTLFSAAS